MQGFASVEDIERAVLEQNAHLPEEDKEDMRRDLTRFKEFFYEKENNHSFLANMVEERSDF